MNVAIIPMSRSVVMPTAFIVDDHSDTADAISTFLQSCGFTTEAYSDLKTAEHMTLRDHPCVLVIDYNMNDHITTPEFIERVVTKLPALKVVVMSGDSSKHVEASRLGADFLLKPVDVEHLEKICKFHCG